jgi:hypothetical protein
MTLYLNLPQGTSKLAQLASLAGAEILSAAPHGLDEVPTGKALICVADMGSYEAPAYIISEKDFAGWAEPADSIPTTWLLIDRDVADDLCPEAPQWRQYWASALAGDAEAAAHTDNLIPVARVDRSWVRIQAGLLRRYAAILRGQAQGDRYDELLTDPGVQRIAASDLSAIARDLESWLEHDWIAVINITAERQYLEGPLPPFPGISPG